MYRNAGTVVGWGSLVLIALCGAARPARRPGGPATATASPYPTMAPISEYRMDRDSEIALARTGAPAPISRDAEVWVLGRKNYEIAVRGRNGYMCVVGRAFGGPLTNPEFWNPKNRSPMCLDPAAARSLWPYAMKQTGMALAGASKAQITDAIRAAVARKELGAPALGSMIYMMSKGAYLTDQGSHNLSHVMFELPRNGVFQDDSTSFVSWEPAPVIEFNVPVGHWSDGTDASGKS